MAFHPRHRVILVVEIKTVLVNAQDLLGTLDVKTRLAPMLARDLGWHAAVVVPAIVVADSSTTRRRLEELAALLARFETRGRGARRWLSDPAEPSTGLLVLRPLPSRNGRDRRRAGRRRVRRSLGSESAGDGQCPPG